jgi:gliding motility-associated-like protein
MMRIIFTSLLSILIILNVKSQTNIGGIINNYTNVTAIACNNVTVGNSSAFSINDRVLIIQMKGAVIDTSNSSSFGNVINYGNCGNYEFATILSISGLTITFQNSLLNNYTLSGVVQLIRVPVYTNAVITSTLTCMPWNGSLGGVLVLEAGSLELLSNIDVSGKGFQGGAGCTNPDGFCGMGYTDYFYAISSGFGAEKGEGITSVGSARKGGRGALANGGGGGNKHNSGGGGGGNYSSGGLGGKQANFCPSVSVGGIGGNGLDYTLNKLFLGGGGGCSDNNNGVGTAGTNGGAIIIIRSNDLIGNSKSIISNGPAVGVIPNGIGDGAGGGGAGGTIILAVNNYTGLLNVNANGGKGGDQNTSYGSCFGPGGGAGAGMIGISLSSLPLGVTATTAAGAAGTDVHPFSGCYNTSYGAMPGQTAAGIKYGIVLNESNSTIPQNTVFAANDTTSCTDSLLLNAYSPGASYIWSTSDTTSQIVVTSPGLYWVSVSGGACQVTLRDTIAVNFLSDTAAGILNTSSDCNDYIELLAYPSGQNYLWSTGETTSSIIVSSPGIYWLYVNSACTSIADTVILPAPVYTFNVSMIPNVITANADSQNDLIKIGSINGPELLWEIYNRWGQKVFSGSGPELEWNGTSKEASLSAGTYFWILQYEEECSGKKEQAIFKGFITLIK